MFIGGKCYSQKKNLKDWIRERDSYTCQLCGKEGYIVDHIIPWRVSHDSRVSNLRVLCHACNLQSRRQAKRRRPIDYDAYLRLELAKYR